MAFVCDPIRAGCHVLMFDPVCREQEMFNNLSDLDDSVPRLFINQEYSGLTKFICATKRQRRHPILSIHYGDMIGLAQAKDVEVKYEGRMEPMSNTWVMECRHWMTAVVQRDSRS